ncbi:YqgE/AlgH family protein [Parabacteroides merdae]|nr:YqgE/AlgH family protein [Parabacteroides merdae]
MKFFLGYSGWQEGQLHNEIDQNSWVVSHASNRNVLLAEGEGFGKNRSNRSEANMKRGPNTRKNPR